MMTDIKSFLAVFFIGILGFANSYYVLELYKNQKNVDDLNGNEVTEIAGGYLG